MIKKYTNKDYADKAIEATNTGNMLYIHTYTEEIEKEVPKIEYTQDAYGDEIETVNGTETESEIVEYAELLIAPPNYYVCYKDNYTDGTINENYEKEKEEAERKRLDSLSLTAADVERAIYKAKGMDFDDLIAMVEKIPGMDIKGFKIELRANNFFRNHPYINQLGTLLGYTSDDLDYLFTNKELPNKE